MKDSQKSPVFSTKDYVRPNLNWECGHLRKGCPCRIGPSPKGKCRATYECEPALGLKPGETRGHWTCTRPKSAGGKCENGPLPDGTCCNAIPKCQPRRTLRSLRKRVTAFTIVATCLILFAGIDRSMRDEFINPGPISSVHASEHFAKSSEASGDAGNCAACHDSAMQDGDLWHSKVIDAFKSGLAPAELIRAGPIEKRVSAMDEKCLECHEVKDFHQPNMAGEFACHTCHKEHETSGSMPPVNSNYCTACHGNESLMAVSGKMAAGMDPRAFPFHATSAAIKLQLRERPGKGYTKKITAFQTKLHPEFQLKREDVSDKNSLKFNHEFHLQLNEIKGIEGESARCSICHEQDARGEYLQPIIYEQHCAECHPLQFDSETPGLHLPHGDPYYVRAFLRSYNIQIEEHGRSKEGKPENQLDQYVGEKVESFSEQYDTGEYLERAVFFADNKKQILDGGRAQFEGCATCHTWGKPDNPVHDIEDVSIRDLRMVLGKILKPVSITDRWMVLGKFNHEMHKKDLDCADCHDVRNSNETRDLNLPSINTCFECHNPERGIDSSCTKCHTYHNSRPP